MVGRGLAAGRGLNHYWDHHRTVEDRSVSEACTSTTQMARELALCICSADLLESFSLGFTLLIFVLDLIL